MGWRHSGWLAGKSTTEGPEGGAGSGGRGKTRPRYRSRSHGRHPGFQKLNSARLSETERRAWLNCVYRWSQELHRVARGWLQARASHPAVANRVAEGRQIGSSSGRPSDWQSAAVADRNLSRREPRSDPGLPGRIHLSPQSATATHRRVPDPAPPRNRSQTYTV